MEIRIPRPLPTINCDPVLIQEVLVNLISNAVKYNDKPEQWVEIGYMEGNQELETGHKGLLPTPHTPLPTSSISATTALAFVSGISTASSGCLSGYTSNTCVCVCGRERV
jgi:hypothetical protein